MLSRKGPASPGSMSSVPNIWHRHLCFGEGTARRGTLRGRRPVLYFGDPGGAAVHTWSCKDSSAHLGVQAQGCSKRHRGAAPCSVVCDTDLHDDAIRAALYGSGCRHRPAQSRLLHRAVQLRMTSQIRTAVREIARRRASPTFRDLHSSMQAPESCAGPRPPRNRDEMQQQKSCQGTRSARVLLDFTCVPMVLPGLLGRRS